MNVEFNNLTFSIRSFTMLDDLFFPIIVNISNIYDNNFPEIIEYKVNFISNKDGELKYEIDKTDFPYKEQIELFELKNKIYFIHSFIDFSLINTNNENVSALIKKIYNLDITKKEDFFTYFINNSNIKEEDITRIMYEINFLVIKCKNIFIERAIDYLDFKRQLPGITLDKKSQLIDQYKDYMEYPIGLMELQQVSEYPMSIWFEENIGKSYNEWSWREKQLKKMYITTKVRLENFRELVKAKQFEIDMPKK